MTVLVPSEPVTMAPTGNACLNDLAIDGDRLAAVADDGRVRELRLVDGRPQLEAVVTPPGPRILANAVGRRDDLVAVGNHEHQLLRFTPDLLDPHPDVTDLGRGPVNSIVATRHGDLLVATYAGVVVHVDRSGEEVDAIDLGDGAVKSLAVDDETDRVTAATAGGSLFTWQLGEAPRALPGHRSIVNDLALCPDGERVVSVGRDFVLRVTRLEGEPWPRAVELPRPPRSPKSVAVVDDGTAVVGDYWGGLVGVDLVHGRTRRRQIARNGIAALAVTADGLVVAASYDGSVTTVAPRDLEVVDRLLLMGADPRPDPDHEGDR